MIALFHARARAMEKCWVLIIQRQLPINTPRMIQTAKVISKTLPLRSAFLILCNFINFFFLRKRPLGLIPHNNLSLLHVLPIGPIQRRARALPCNSNHFPSGAIINGD